MRLCNRAENELETRRLGQLLDRLWEAADTLPLEMQSWLSGYSQAVLDDTREQRDLADPSVAQCNDALAELARTELRRIAR